jgi:excisionase family DNA binding protein
MADVTRLFPGFIVSDEGARELVAALDQLDHLAAPRGQRLNQRLVTIKREFETSASRVSTPAYASAEGFVAQEVAEFEMSVVDTTTAAHQLGIKRDSVTWLCRNGQLRATRTGGRWFIEAASLQDYRARRGHTKEA